MYSSTYYPHISIIVPITLLLAPQRVVRFVYMSYYISLCLSNQNNTRLHSRSGHIATSYSVNFVVLVLLFRVRLIDLYSLIYIFKFLAYMQSLGTSSQKLQMQLRQLVMQQVNSKLRINNFYSRQLTASLLSTVK